MMVMRYKTFSYFFVFQKCYFNKWFFVPSRFKTNFYKVFFIYNYQKSIVKKNIFIEFIFSETKNKICQKIKKQKE